MFQACLINNVYAELEVKDIETFENKTHLGIGLSNFMLKGYLSRDLNRNTEIGLNASVGSFALYNFKENRDAYFFNKNIMYPLGYNIEADLKKHFNRPDYLNPYHDTSYIKYFLGTSFTRDAIYNPDIDGSVSSYYLGAGLGKVISFNGSGFNIGLNMGFDLGLNMDIYYNSIAFIFFPRLSIGLETRF